MLTFVLKNIKTFLFLVLVLIISGGVVVIKRQSFDLEERVEKQPLEGNESITVYQRLNEDGWSKQERPFSNYPDLDFYAYPQMPEQFPAFLDFLKDKSLDEIVEKMHKEKSIFVVKNDQNTQFQSIFDFHDLDSIQYILIFSRKELYLEKVYLEKGSR